MSKKRVPNLAAFIVIGISLIAVAISTENYGFLGAGLLFIGIGIVSIVRAREIENADQSGDEKQDDQ